MHSTENRKEKRKEKIGGSTKKLKGQFTWLWLASCTVVSKSRNKEKKQKIK
jgi:hypothetical protein